MAIPSASNPVVDELNIGNVNVKKGTGTPTYSAAQGSLFIRTDGSTTSSRLYINTTGATAWTSITTAA